LMLCLIVILALLMNYYSLPLPDCNDDGGDVLLLQQRLPQRLQLWGRKNCCTNSYLHPFWSQSNQDAFIWQITYITLQQKNEAVIKNSLHNCKISTQTESTDSSQVENRSRDLTDQSAFTALNIC
ncbi:hypothetical protein T4A_13483, partial [Trichinella pseudospiralis]